MYYLQKQKESRRTQSKRDAATIEENGKAMALVLQMLTDAWLRAGNDAKDIFLIQQLEEVLQTVITRIKGMEVGEVTLIDGGDGNALPRHIASFPKAVRQVMEELHASTGVDITGILAKTNINTDKSGEPWKYSSHPFVSFFAIIAGGLIAKTLFMFVVQTRFWSSLVAVIWPLKMSMAKRGKSPEDTVSFEVVAGYEFHSSKLLINSIWTNISIEVSVNNAYARGGSP